MNDDFRRSLVGASSSIIILQSITFTDQISTNNKCRLSLILVNCIKGNLLYMIYILLDIEGDDKASSNLKGH